MSMTFQKFSAINHARCDCCGQFVNPGAPGVSGSQTWGYCSDGSPELYDPVYRCSACTDKHGGRESNCHPPGSYMWRNPRRLPLADRRRRER